MKRGLLLAAVAALAGVAAVVIAEAALRILDLRPPGWYTSIRIENDPSAGPWALPSQTVVYEAPCLTVRDIHINRFGMRDRERTLDGSLPRIVLLGDSMTQALQVGDEETVSRRLEALFDNRVEVLNFGISSTGTAVQLLLYRKYVRRFRPDVVLVMFFVGNDVVDNLPALKRRHDPFMAEISPYFLLDERGRLRDEVEPGRWRRTSRLRPLLGYSTAGRWLYHAYTSARLRTVPRSEAAATPAAATPTSVAAAGEPERRLYDDAWRITEQVLSRFHTEVRRDGAHFGVVVIPSDLQSLGSSGRINAETGQAVERLTALAERERFPLLDLARVFQERIAGEGPLELAYPCDGHLNARGHAEAAAGVRRFVARERLL